MIFAVAYYRVSTSRQGRSGLGLEAQQTAVKYCCKNNGYTLLREIQEVRSTRKHRPRLQEAIDLCLQERATLIVARLDRLGRDVEEIAHNIKLPIEIIVTDNPYANRFTIHILAAVAEEERRKISINTKDALKAARKKGKKLGKNGKKLAIKNKKEADKFAAGLKPVIQSLNSKGIKSVRAIAEELNNRKVPTFRKDGQWHATTVFNLLARLKMKNNL